MCLVLAVLSLAAALYYAMFQVDVLGNSCGSLASPDEYTADNAAACDVALRSRGQLALAAGIAGAGWMIGYAALTIAGAWRGAVAAPRHRPHLIPTRLRRPRPTRSAAPSQPVGPAPIPRRGPARQPVTPPRIADACVPAV